MSRATNREVMGFFAIGEKHHEAILSLIAPSTTNEARILDPFAGEGDFLYKASNHWNLTPYANELDKSRAETCIAKFGADNAVQGDVERLSASLEAFSVGWYNPPYDNDKLAETPEAKRIEYRYLRHAWKWIQTGGIVMWVVYKHHITEPVATFFSRHASSVDIWGLEEKHLGEYDQIIVVAIKGKHRDPQVLFDQIMLTKDTPRPLTVQPNPIYHIPPPPSIARFVFAPDLVSPELGLKLIQERGAHHNPRFNALFATPPDSDHIETIVPPRPGHMAYVLAGVATSGIVMETETYGKVAMRSVVEHIEERSETVVTAGGAEQTTITSKPRTSITLLSQSGQIIPLSGDEAILDFIVKNKERLIQFVKGRFQPRYAFDYGGFKRILDGIRLNGKHELFTPQKHVIGAVLRGFETRRSILLVGQMGTGKTSMGGTVATIIGSGAHPTYRDHITKGGVIVIVCPPHLADKWRCETLSINPNAVIHKVNRHEELKAFMDIPHQLGHPKIAIIKRDMTKLGSGWSEAVVWRKFHRAETLSNGEKITHTYECPSCPHCGALVQPDRETWTRQDYLDYLQKSKRECDKCNLPLWQEIRPTNTVDGNGRILANPRYRLDQYIKRKYRRSITLLVWDEVHEAQHSDTGNGEAFGRLANCANAVLALTGTPFNGYSSSLFNLEYTLNPRVKREYYWGGAVRYTKKQRGSKSFQQPRADQTRTSRGEQETRWVAQMGVREKVEVKTPTYSAGKLTGTETYERPYTEAPGISPLLVAEMLDHTIYFSLADLKKHLPMYSEVAYSVPMDASMESEYEDVTKKLLAAMDYERTRPKDKRDNTILPKYLQFTMNWVNSPWREYIVRDKDGDEIAKAVAQDYQPPEMSDTDYFLRGGDELFPKEQELITYVQKELAEGRACIIYCRQTQKNDIQPRLQSLLSHLGDAYILRSNINAERREKVIDRQRELGMEILICNPELIKTGLDLVFAQTIIFYEPTFNLSTMMQASARSYRLNQTGKLCRVVYFYYEGTMEQRAIMLMSKKQRSSKLLTGDIGLSGLDALTEKEDGFESALMNSIGKDARLDAPDFTREKSQYAEFDNADLAFWNVESDTPIEAPTIRDAFVLDVTRKVVAQVIAMRGISAPTPVHHNPSRETVLGTDGDKTILQLRLF